MKALLILTFIFSSVSFAQTKTTTTKTVETKTETKDKKKEDTKTRVDKNGNVVNIYNNVNSHDHSSCQKPKTIIKYKYIKAKPVVKYVEKIVYRERPAKKKKRRPKIKRVVRTVTKYKQKKHALSVLGMASKTDIDSEVRTVSNGFDQEIKREYEEDLGFMYQYDTDSDYRLSIGGSLRGTGFLGIGLVFD